MISAVSIVDKPGAVPSSATNALSVSPPPNLIAALRHVFDVNSTNQTSKEPALPSGAVKVKVDTKVPIIGRDSGSGLSRFELRHLLQSITCHPIFTTIVASPAVAVAAKHEHVASAITSSINFDEQQVNLEKLIMNVAKQLTSNSEEIDKETSLQGLMIAVLSLLTTSQSGFTVNSSTADVAENKSPTTKAVERQDNDLPPQSMLQVGALLSLLPLESISTPCTVTSSTESAVIVDTLSADSASHRLNPELLDYFASAAEVYQERLEIRKARRLARLQAPSPTESVARCHTPSLKSSFKQKETSTGSGDDVSNNEDSNANSQRPTISSEDAETPTTKDRGTPDMEFSLRTEDDDNIYLTPSNNNSATPISNAHENRNVDPPASSSTELIAVSDREEGLLPSNSMNDLSDDAFNESHQDDTDDVAAVPFDMDGELLENGAIDEEEEDNDEDDEGDVDEPSSSSGSESSDDEEEDGMGDSDDADALDTDDEDAVLRQAMAMSIAEQVEVDAERQGEKSCATAHLSSGLRPSDDRDSSAVSTHQTNALKVTESPVAQSTDRDIMRNEEDDDSNLPPLPSPPTSYQFLIPTGSGISALVPEYTKAGAESLSSISQLDPSKLSDFGSVPACYVLLHFLRYATLEMDRRLSLQAKARSSPVVVRGGVGSSLFTLDHSNSDRTDSITSNDKKGAITLQLMVASILLMIEHRSDAIENLRKAIAREQRMAHDGTYDSDDENAGSNGEDESSRLPLSLSGEEDDPALTLAMNYVEDDAPLSSESLESKGMTRKAAAAAYDAATVMKSLRKSTNSWKYEVHLTSSCLACSLQILRMYLQSMVRQYFISAEFADECTNCQSVAELRFCFPDSVRANITQKLSSLMSIGTQSSLVAMMSGDVIETERLFQSRFLYKEAMGVWGECIPLIFCSDSSRSALLRSLIEECSGFSNPLPHLISLDKLNDFPNSDVETQFYKVSTMCIRLRVGDLLDSLVSRPLHFVGDMSMDLKSEDSYASRFDSIESDQSTKSVVALLTFLSNSVGSLVGDHCEVKRFYLALCHRCQSRALLLDGFYAETETELDDRHALSSAKTLSTGDKVRVAAGPSAGLQFDATKCSDSIAAYSGQDDDSRVASTGICSVHQRASKVWGTVLSTQQYSPKTGVHRWAVRLDKCERGHVFIGVATSQATMKTYVGGDKYGWGMIGTQALWHDRRKVCSSVRVF